jgi:hypothetical protein
MSESLGIKEATTKDWINSILKSKGIEVLSFSTAQCELLELMFESYPGVLVEMLKLITSDIIPFYQKCTSEVDILELESDSLVSQECPSDNAQKYTIIQLPHNVLRRARLVADFKEKIIADIRFELRLMLRMTIDEMVTFACYDCDPMLRRFSQSSFDAGVYLVGQVRDLSFNKEILEKEYLNQRLRKLYSEQLEYGSSFLGIKTVPSYMKHRLALILINVVPSEPLSKTAQLGSSRYLDNYGRGN